MAKKTGTSDLRLPGRDPAELRLTFAGNVVKHLGVQMYAGRPVPAIAELISNAWDADAKTVRVVIPLGQAWEPGNEKHVIQVEDDGLGMTWDMVRDAYLDVGSDRRQRDKSNHSPGGRLLQGRKGVGKLAGFGIADIVEIQTVHRDPDPSIKKRALIWFRLAWDDLKKVQKGPARVQLVYAGPVSGAPKGGRKDVGTTVSLRRLHSRRAANEEAFRRSMTRRFLLLGPGFRVKVNKADLKVEHIPLQWRWPDKGWTEDEIPGCGPVKYWLGFSEKPRQQSEGDLSGILIYTRGKVSQESTFFDISGGVTGQHGLRYLCGMIQAEWLDAGAEDPDLIATHRGSIAWESPQGQAFEKWGRELIRRYLAEWAKRRAKLRERHVRELSPHIKGRIDRLSPAYREVAHHFVEKFDSVEMEPEEFADILGWFLDALENATLRNILEKLRQADTTDLEGLDDLLTKMEVRTAVTLLQIIDSNIAAIEALEKMHLEDAKERGVLSKHLERNPWLMDPTWMLSKAEGRVTTWIRNEFALDKKKAKGDADRVDFFCVAVGGTLHIVEIKRGGHVAKDADFLQAAKYLTYVQRRFKEMTDPKAIKYTHVQSHLVAAELHQDATKIQEAYADKGWVFFTTWDDLVERAKLSHEQFRKALADAAEAHTAAEDSGPGEARGGEAPHRGKASRGLIAKGGTAKKGQAPRRKNPLGGR